MAERRLLTEREVGRAGRREAMDAVRAVVPESAFQMQIEELELDDDINRALSRMENVGELMIRMLADEENLERTLKQGGAGDDAMEAIRYALEDLVVLRRADEQPGPEPEPETVPPLTAEPVVAAEPGPVPDAVPVLVDDEDAYLLPAFGDASFVEETKPVNPDVTTPEWHKEERRKLAHPEALDEEAPEKEIEDEDRVRKAGKKGKAKQRELVFDEERGEVVARRRRKGSRRRGEEWEEYLD
jgi:hypothetical protein